MQKARQAAFGRLLFVLVIVLDVLIVFLIEHIAFLIRFVGGRHGDSGGFVIRRNVEDVVHIRSGRLCRRVGDGLCRGLDSLCILDHRLALVVFLVLGVVVLVLLVLAGVLAAQTVADGVAGTGEEGEDGAEGIGIDRFIRAVALGVVLGVILGVVVFVVVFVVLVRRVHRRLVGRDVRRGFGHVLRGNVHRRFGHILRGHGLGCLLRGRDRLRRLLHGGDGLRRFLRGRDGFRRFLRGGVHAPGALLRHAGAVCGLLRLFLRMPAAKPLVPFNEQIIIQIGAIFPVSCHRNDRLSFRLAARGCLPHVFR